MFNIRSTYVHDFSESSTSRSKRKWVVDNALISSLTI